MDADIATNQAEFETAKNKADLARKWGISRQYLYSLDSNA